MDEVKQESADAGEISTENAVLALDSVRAVTLKTAKQTYTYQLRRITGDDWAKYYAGIVDQTENHGNDRDRIFDAEPALLQLVADVLVGVSGFGENAGANWRQRIPLAHRRAIGATLVAVAPVRGQNDEPELCDLVTIKLDATWSTAEKTLVFNGLIHRFRQPSIEDLVRFNRESKRVKSRGTGDDGITIYPSRHSIAMKMYDDLIESVDGYSVNGQPLADVAAIKREMDGAHKAAAALDLFVGGEQLTIA